MLKVSIEIGGARDTRQLGIPSLGDLEVCPAPTDTFHKKELSKPFSPLNQYSPFHYFTIS